ncbi:MAG TPA: methyltransferase domain-containing protein [Microvirga sp.]|nr:methyltransferase domain-containing protein [Microvirga sp.]
MRQPDGEQDWLARCPERLRDALRACASGQAPANVALLKILIAALDRDEAERALRTAHEAARSESERRRIARALALLRENPQAFDTVKGVLRGVDHRGTAATLDQGLAHWAAAFDRMAESSPEGSVALYALGNPDLLRAVTAEIVDRLASWGLLGPERLVLDLGCGIGRLTQALSPLVGRVTGIDISPVMIDRARERCRGLPNVALRLSSGRDLEGFADASFDLVVAADVFPYLVQTGPDLAAAHVAEAARVLRPGGALVILNMSYRNDPVRDLAELAALAARSGLALARHGERDFTWWDARTFQLIRPG